MAWTEVIHGAGPDTEMKHKFRGLTSSHKFGARFARDARESEGFASASHRTDRPYRDRKIELGSGRFGVSCDAVNSNQRQARLIVTEFPEPIGLLSELVDEFESIHGGINTDVEWRSYRATLGFFRGAHHGSNTFFRQPHYSFRSSDLPIKLPHRFV